MKNRMVVALNFSTHLCHFGCYYSRGMCFFAKNIVIPGLTRDSFQILDWIAGQARNDTEGHLSS
jgi:hypothetical protein